MLLQDWKDLWRPELAGKISMVGSPREVVGAVLKYMGVSYNISDIDSQVDGGRDAVQRNLNLLANQVEIIFKYLLMHLICAFIGLNAVV